jgi:hypothetical protein
VTRARRPPPRVAGTAPDLSARVRALLGVTLEGLAACFGTDSASGRGTAEPVAFPELL